MIQVQLKNLGDFKRLVNGQSIVFMKKSIDGFTYYVLLKQFEVEIINVFKSKNPLMLTENFDPDECEGICVGSLVEIVSISVHGRVLHE